MVAPPVPIPNTEVKRCSPDGSTAIGRARVGRRQNKSPGEFITGVFAFGVGYSSRKHREFGSRRLDRERTTPRVDTEMAVATTRSNSGASFRSKNRVITRRLIRALLKSRLACHGLSRLPLFSAKLNFPSRHIFFQVGER